MTKRSIGVWYLACDALVQASLVDQIRRDTGQSGPWPGLSGEVARPGPDFKISAWPGPDRPADNWRRPGPARISMK